MASIFPWLLLLGSAVIMLFELRSLLQSSAADYYHPLTQAVTKLTNPLVNIPLWRNVRMGSFFMHGFVVAALVALVLWAFIALFMLQMPLWYIPLAAFLTLLKTTGYLIIFLLLAQALTSWLPATRSWSFLFAQINAPIVAPVQRIIPPIGMIDISLMVVLIAIYALNSLMYTLLKHIDFGLMIIWRLV